MAELDVLVIDDDPALVRVLTVGFEARGYEVRAAATGGAGLDAVEEREPDIVILDLGLPDIDGIDVCRHLRHRTRRPIIVLSADGAEKRKVGALDLGADDYLTKPFSMEELLARVRVAIRHHRDVPDLDDRPIAVGSLLLDQAAHEAHLAGQPLDTTRKEFALLVLLGRNSGRVLTHRTILTTVWGADQPLDTLRTHVSNLRRKLGTGDGAPRIVTAPGVGYRLLAPGDEGWADA